MSGRKRKLVEPSQIIPAIPEGETDVTINEQRDQLVAFCKSNKQDMMLVNI